MGLLSDEIFDRHDASIQRKRGMELREALAASGSVALIKSGQALSLRPDLLKNTIWAQELGKLVDEVGSFNDIDAMRIMRHQLKDIPAVKPATGSKVGGGTKKKRKLSYSF